MNDRNWSTTENGRVRGTINSWRVRNIISVYDNRFDPEAMIVISVRWRRSNAKKRRASTR